jgi:hypothetical protein
MDEGCVYCGSPATCWLFNDEFVHEPVCDECGAGDDMPDLSPYL